MITGGVKLSYNLTIPPPPTPVSSGDSHLPNNEGEGRRLEEEGGETGREGEL